MSKLVAMRNRIKAIKTIKKITHAMRLISMSNQTRLKKQHEAMTTYVESIATLFSSLQSATKEWVHPIFTPSKKGKTLRIIIGSQKGLCGSFNTSILRTLEDETITNNVEIAVIGKKVVTHCLELFKDNVIYTENELTTRNMHDIAKHITTLILDARTPYSQVIVHSNLFKSFFTQEATVSEVLPIKKTKTTQRAPEYVWEQDHSVVLETLATQYLSAHIEYYVFQSLLSEHAARFVSMDNSTRNADSLLEVTTRTYNKLRQAKITTEITELSSNF